MNVLVCNLTRFGDLLQSQAAIADLHVAGFAVDLICLDNFVSAARMLRNVRNVYPLPGAALLAKTAGGQWPQAIATLREFVAATQGNIAPDYVLNLTTGAPGRLLCRLLTPAGGKSLGFGLDKFGFGVDHGVWASFFAVAARRRINSPFNLVDMLRQMAAPACGGATGSFRLAEPDAEAMRWAEGFLRARPAPGHVAFQLGASEDRRRWPVEFFSDVGNAIWQKTGMIPVLLGTSAERHLADAYARMATHPWLNAAGQTSLPQLAALLKRSRLLLTNDTGTMHLASGLGVPCLAIFLATAQPWDTGPALPGCCCLEPALACHPCGFGQPCARENHCANSISSKTVASLALSWLQSGEWPCLDAPDARIWRTAADSAGYCRLEPLSPACAHGPGPWLGWQRNFWRQLFDEMTWPNKPQNEDLPAACAGIPQPQNAPEIAGNLDSGASLLQVIADCAARAAAPGMGKIFLRNCERLRDLWAQTDQLNSLAFFWDQFRMNHAGDAQSFGNQCRVMASHVAAFAAALRQAA